MTHHEAGELAAYAHKLFPVTNQERIDSFGVMLLDFPNSSLARQVLLNFSHEAPANGLDIPKIRDLLEADSERQKQSASAKLQAVSRERQEYETRKSHEMSYVDASFAKVDALLNDFSGEDLEAMKADVVKDFPFMAKSDVTKARGLRSVLYTRLMKPLAAAPRPSQAPRVSAVQHLDLGAA